MRLYPLMSKGYKKEQKHQNPRDNERRLFEVADSQQGFFAAKQAVAAGYSEKNHAFHVHAGNWVRELHGVYRLQSYPQSLESHLVLWSLWSRGKDGIPQGIYSHETVLSHYDLSDINPARLHMTVPTRFKRMAKPPENLVLYKSDIPKEDIRQLHGYQMTTVKRALEDMFHTETYSKDLIESAVSEALKSGHLTVSELENSQVLEPFKKVLQKRK
jgi:predicted transcriptional regulator of viral defense system